MRLVLTNKAQDDLDRLPSREAANVLALLELWEDTDVSRIFDSNMRKVRSVSEGMLVARVGTLRIFFTIDNEEILILSVVNRHDLKYEDLPKRLKSNQ